jgi:hypothetical protein
MNILSDRINSVKSSFELFELAVGCNNIPHNYFLSHMYSTLLFWMHVENNPMRNLDKHIFQLFSSLPTSENVNFLM